eukprot:m.289147 g.289147  ORF g.289147 m.289147 type:complete len:569 (+) comp15808_c1_seq2:68-1774(+)
MHGCLWRKAPTRALRWAVWHRRSLSTTTTIASRANGTSVHSDNAESETVTALPRDSNQARGIAEYALNMLADPEATLQQIDHDVIHRTNLFHKDSVVCGVSALQLGLNAPRVFRQEALESSPSVPSESAYVFGSAQPVSAAKAALANCAAVRELDANGTVFGYNPKRDNRAGEFGHNDYYPAVIAACTQANKDGRTALCGMIALDEIRGRLAEMFSLKSYQIDHVLHGGVAVAAVYGALVGASAQEIESAIGMLVCHHVPFRAIRAGHQLSDSKGASAAITTEAAINCVQRSMRGFIGAADVFRNPSAVYLVNEPQAGQSASSTLSSPFDLHLSHAGRDFAVMDMHFKLGVYEHQSCSALQAIVNLVSEHSDRFVGLSTDDIDVIAVTIYQPAFGIIGDPAKRNPTTRQSADHSMLFILSRFIHRVLTRFESAAPTCGDEVWKECVLTANDYMGDALYATPVRELMERVEFAHGGPAYDALYPDGIPTKVQVALKDGTSYDSGLICHPSGHARNTACDLESILHSKWNAFLQKKGREESQLVSSTQLDDLASCSSQDLAALYTKCVQL